MKDNGALHRIGRYLLPRVLVVVSIVIPIFLLVGILWIAGAAAQQPAQINPQPPANQTIKVEFAYMGSDLAGAAVAADEFASLLAVETGLDIQASISWCMADVAHHLGIGQVDVAPLSSFTYVKERDTYGFNAELAFVRFGYPYYGGQINVLTAKGYTDIWDLQNKSFAAPSPSSTSGYLLPYLLISDTTGMTPDQFFSEVTFSGHSQVIRDVYSGTVDSGSTYNDARYALQGELPDVLSVVEVLTTTEFVPKDPWVFRDGLDPSTTHTLTTGIVAVAGTTEGQNALEPFIGSVEGAAPVSDSQYDITQRLAETFGLSGPVCYRNYLPAILTPED
jgi:phosphate/phosphite/phosphonate ABC transporter binding protein